MRTGSKNIEIRRNKKSSAGKRASKSMCKHDSVDHRSACPPGQSEQLVRVCSVSMLKGKARIRLFYH